MFLRLRVSITPPRDTPGRAYHRLRRVILPEPGPHGRNQYEASHQICKLVRLAGLSA